MAKVKSKEQKPEKPEQTENKTRSRLSRLKLQEKNITTITNPVEIDKGENTLEDFNVKISPNFFKNLSVRAGKIGIDEIVKIIGLRESYGSIFAAVLFKSKNNKILSSAVLDLKLLKEACFEDLQKFLIANVH